MTIKKSCHSEGNVVDWRISIKQNHFIQRSLLALGWQTSSLPP